MIHDAIKIFSLSALDAKGRHWTELKPREQEFIAHALISNHLKRPWDKAVTWDIGSGVGRSSFLAKRSGARVICIDGSQDIVTQLVKIGMTIKSDAYCHDLTRGIPKIHPLPDIVYCIDTIRYLDEMDKVVGAIYRRLKPGGVAAMSVELHDGNETVSNGTMPINFKGKTYNVPQYAHSKSEIKTHIEGAGCVISKHITNVDPEFSNRPFNVTSFLITTKPEI